MDSDPSSLIPGTVAEWGGFAAFEGLNEGIVTNRFSRYGQTGPDAELRGFGSIAEGCCSGLAQATGFPDSEPVRSSPPAAVFPTACVDQFAMGWILNGRVGAAVSVRSMT